MNIGNWVDFLSRQETIIASQQFFVFAFNLGHRDIIFVKLFVILDGPSIQLVKLLSLIVNGRANWKRIGILFIAIIFGEIIDFGSISA